MKDLHNILLCHLTITHDQAPMLFACLYFWDSQKARVEKSVRINKQTQQRNAKIFQCVGSTQNFGMTQGKFWP